MASRFHVCLPKDQATKTIKKKSKDREIKMEEKRKENREKEKIRDTMDEL